MLCGVRRVVWQAIKNRERRIRIDRRVMRMDGSSSESSVEALEVDG